MWSRMWERQPGLTLGPPSPSCFTPGGACFTSVPPSHLSGRCLCQPLPRPLPALRAQFLRTLSLAFLVPCPLAWGAPSTFWSLNCHLFATTLKCQLPSLSRGVAFSWVSLFPIFFLLKKIGVILD